MHVNSKWRGALRSYPVPLLLCAVALTQMFLARFSHLSPWKGGGFGMFSVMSLRSLGCEVKVAEGKWRPCAIPFRGQGEYGPFTATRRKSLVTYPTQAKLESILQDYKKMGLKVRTYNETDLTHPQGPQFLEELPSLGLKLTLTELEFDPATLQVVFRPIPGLSAQEEGWALP